MAHTVSVTRRALGISPDGSAAQTFALRNGSLRLEVLSFGARVTSLLAPDRDGAPGDVVLGYNELARYLDDDKFLGATVGRFANRIAQGRFTLGGKEHQLSVNNGPNSLHGGADGFWHRNWEARELPDGVEFSLTSPDCDQGFPGTSSVLARYRLEGPKVVLEYEATTDQTTVVNLTNHAYFNLSGEGNPTILDHVLQLEADQYTPIDATSIPLGSLDPVAGTPFDFTAPHAIGERIHAADQQLSNGGGYDHNFVRRGEAGVLKRAAVVTHPGTGRKLEIQTSEPGVQFYSGNYLDGLAVGKSGAPYGFRSAFCLETQHFPDSPNQPAFPTTVLQPGLVFRSTTTWTFSAD